MRAPMRALQLRGIHKAIASATVKPTSRRPITTFSPPQQSNTTFTPIRRTPQANTSTGYTARSTAPTQNAAPAQTPAPPYPRQTLPPVQTERNIAANPPQEPITDLSQSGLSDQPSKTGTPSEENVDWTTSFSGLSSQAFSKEASDILMQPVNTDDIEIKADGILYLPEIKYRRILNRAFGPGGWGLAPRGETIVTAKCVTREYALVANGR